MVNREAISDCITVRSGLGGVRKRLEKGPARIAYLGLSVTAQRDGYRMRLHQWITSHFGQAHQPVNAGIGDVGSISCAFLMDDFVSPFRPELCFIECTTGDVMGKTRLADIAGAVEGIVLKLAGIGCRACILHLPWRDPAMVAPEDVIEEYERVADFHGVPSIHLYRYIGRSAQLGEIDLGQLQLEGLHTTPAGAQLYADCLGGALEVLFAAPDSPPLPLVDAGDACCMENLRLASIRPVEHPGEANFRGRYPLREVGVGSAILFQPDGCDLKGLFLVVGPDSGIIEVTTPVTARRYQTWDVFCTYNRLSTVILDEPIPAGTPVSIRPIAEGSPPTSNSILKLIGWLVLGGRDVFSSENRKNQCEEPDA